ncbi:dipeptidase [Sporomusa sp. KB1]|uniref:dipeptidase n=1 Tax=Sporomusa sp. KB1 TaxID=943346 RepID=UPI00119DCDAB|nr:dipeptidase [Sporomusa sp. KB1]TWH46703.1 membrane dipeptidase [Sporomusa sp. KB1]
MNSIDLHCDTIMRLMEGDKSEGLYRNSLSVDIEKLQAGKAQAQFFAMFINLQTDGDPLVRALRMIDRFYQEIEDNKQYIALARNYGEFQQNQADGKLSAFLTIEEGGALKGELINLRNFYRLGVRLITLTWNYPNEIGHPSALPECRERGLTPFGREVVAEMNRLGMIIDVSHLSNQGLYEVAALTQKPFVASHSNAWSVTTHHRNLTDEMIKVLATKGGVMGINFEKSFLGSAPFSRVEDMVLHIQHIYNVGGIEVIAIGSDFDGISPELELAHAGEMSKLVDALGKAGFGQAEIDKICWKNALRVIKDTLQ